MFMLGFAYQQALLPVSAEAIERAIELNAVAVDANKQAFAWGRRAAIDPASVEKIMSPADSGAGAPARTLDEIISHRVAQLTAYQNDAYAQRYKNLVRRVEVEEKVKAKGKTGLAEAVARYFYKLMAYKDEYEVARLYADPAFERQLREVFEGDFKLKFHLAPPLFSRRDLDTCELKKKTYGPWVFTAFKLLARMKGLRGTPFDIFGYTAERKHERGLIDAYEATIAELLERLDVESHALAVEIAEIPEHIRGYGHVKERHLAEAKTREAELLATLRRPAAPRSAAE